MAAEPPLVGVKVLEIAGLAPGVFRYHFLKQVQTADFKKTFRPFCWTTMRRLGSECVESRPCNAQWHTRADVRSSHAQKKLDSGQSEE